jgi:hypothetical protein
MVGSDGFSGVKSWPAEYGGKEFIAWAIEESIDDVCLVNEHQLPAGIYEQTMENAAERFAALCSPPSKKEGE